MDIEPPILSDAEQSARNKRNLAIALCLLGFVALVFIITVVRMSGGAVPERM
jgi:hypothetical protein